MIPGEDNAAVGMRLGQNLVFLKQVLMKKIKEIKDNPIKEISS